MSSAEGWAFELLGESASHIRLGLLLAQEQIRLEDCLGGFIFIPCEAEIVVPCFSARHVIRLEPQDLLELLKQLELCHTRLANQASFSCSEGELAFQLDCSSAGAVTVTGYLTAHSLGSTLSFNFDTGQDQLLHSLQVLRAACARFVGFGGR